MLSANIDNNLGFGGIFKPQRQNFRLVSRPVRIVNVIEDRLWLGAMQAEDVSGRHPRHRQSYARDMGLEGGSAWLCKPSDKRTSDARYHVIERRRVPNDASNAL